jgi:hypothetical protein
VESGDLNTLAQIVAQGGDNSVEVTLEADVTSNPELPDGTRIIFTTGLGTGTLGALRRTGDEQTVLCRLSRRWLRWRRALAPTKSPFSARRHEEWQERVSR